MGGKPTMSRQSIAITGAGGLIGRALNHRLASGGHHVVRLVRRPASGGNEIAWAPASGRIGAADLEGMDAVVHLAGEPIAARRWNRAVMDRILESRVGPTHLLAETLAALEKPPHTLISASAIGYYGNRGDETLDETCPGGVGFLADVCRAWEGATQPAVEAGIRVVNLRIGLVLASDGGALAKMLPAFRLGLGGRIGSGRQWVAWIALDDLVDAIEHLLFVSELSGPVNATAPNPARNADFTHELARALQRPAWMPLPGFAARLLFGKMADETLLASARALPQRLSGDRFAFRHRTLPETLRAILPRL